MSKAKKRSTWLIHDEEAACSGYVSGAFGETIADQLGLVARRIVHDDVNVETRRRYRSAEFLPRWRGMHLPMMVPAFTSRAANSEGEPCRL